MNKPTPGRNEWLRFGAMVGAFCAFAMSAVRSAHAEGADAVTLAAPLDRVMALQLGPGDEIVVRGSLRTSFDGTVFDASNRTDLLPAGPFTRSDGLFDAAGGGLHVVANVPLTHTVRFMASGAEGSACRAAGLSSPCLVPRLRELGHERLLTEADFMTTLSGTIEMTVLKPPSPPMAGATRKAFSLVAFGMLAMVFAILGLHLRRLRRTSALGQVRLLARAAKSVTAKDGTFGIVRAQIDDLVTRAEQLDVARRACSECLSKINRKDLEQKRASWVSSTSPEAAEISAWLSAECAEAARLEADLSASIAGLEKIAAALRVIALHARAHRDIRARLGEDPTVSLESELRLRDDAVNEAERATIRG